MAGGTIRAIMKARGFAIVESDHGEFLCFDRSTTVEGGFDRLYVGIPVEFSRMRDSVTAIRMREPVGEAAFQAAP